MKDLGILGSTGSIGTQALSVIRENPDKFRVKVLSCNKNISLLKEQIKEFKPEAVAVFDEESGGVLKKELPGHEILTGYKGLCDVAAFGNYQLLLNGLMGMIGLEPTYRAIEAGKNIALANKETLVAGGKLIMEFAAERDVDIIPVDSEHSAIFQCMAAAEKNKVKSIILTASGGPFLGKKLDELKSVRMEEALNHPNWSMGKKISIDSATFMNKGLEVIEARWLFDLDAERIRVVVHPESIIHSMIEFEDNAVLAQFGKPDMKVPIALGMSWPDRIKNDMGSLDFAKISKLTFREPDRETFRCLDYAYEALKIGKSATCVLNAANEVLVDKFIKGEIEFPDIQKMLGEIMDTWNFEQAENLEDILELDKEVRERVRRWER